MARVLTGIQSSGEPHLGNLLGAILPALELAEQHQESAFFFIADLHSLTSRKDAQSLQKSTYEVAAAWLACGLNTEKDLLYRQSDIPEVTELMWYLACFTPYGQLKKAHAFKEKSKNLGQVNAGLFTYPVLMAADILLYDAEIVPVGKDQKQHLEITRDLASRINHFFNESIFIIPEPHIREQVMTIPGIDGRKMSKTYNNYINVFWDEQRLRKQVFRIVTAPTPLEAPKDPDKCTVFHLYSLVATAEETEELRKKYLNGGFGFKDAKELLFGKILERFKEAREKYRYFIENPKEIDKIFQQSAERAREVAVKVLNRLRKALGFPPR